jgi:hypothetical protein
MNHRRNKITELHGNGYSFGKIASTLRVSRVDLAKCMAEWGMLPAEQAEAIAAKAEIDMSARNARIRELRQAGIAPTAIIRSMNADGIWGVVTVGVIAGLRHREEGHLSPQGRSYAARRGTLKAKLQHARREARKKANSSHPWRAGAASLQHAREAQAQAVAIPPKPATHREPPRPYAPPLPPKVEIADDPAPTVILPWMEALAGNGCRWPHGDVKDGGISYCGAQRCRVRAQNGGIYSVAYCAEHWEARRASTSRFTKVIA